MLVTIAIATSRNRRLPPNISAGLRLVDRAFTGGVPEGPSLPREARKRNVTSRMPTVTLKAHFDGRQILLDEPFDIPADSPLMVTVLPRSNARPDQDAIAMARAALARAYGDDEPDYSEADLRA